MRDLSIVFDLDGTLVDTAPDLMLALGHCLDKRNFNHPEPDLVYSYIGYGAKRMITTALDVQKINASADLVQDMLDDFLTYYRKNICVESKVFPGVMKCLSSLKACGARLGVCTNKREDLALRLLNELEMTSYFGAVVGVDTLDVRKPHPGHITGTIDLIEGHLDYSIMIGDSETDIRAAQAAGIPVIAVNFGYTDKPVQTFGPDAVISHYDTLISEIKDLQRKLTRPHRGKLFTL